MTYAVGIVGAGARSGEESDASAAMGYRHAEAYRALDSCDLVAVADLDQELATQFADAFELGNDAVFADHRTMIEELDLDVLGVTTPIPTHADIVLDALSVGDLAGIHCEKPMADTWGDCRVMAQEAWRRDVQLTFNHQLRFAEPTGHVVDAIDDGAIGTVERVEMARQDLLEAGIHQVDLCSYFAGDVEAEWAIGQVDYREEALRNGVDVTDQALGQWRYTNGVDAFAATGAGQSAIGGMHRVFGTEGEITFDWSGVHVRRDDAGWESIDCEIGDPLPDAVAHVVDCLGTDTTPLLSAEQALTNHEIVYGIYESVRRRGRVDFPLTVEDNPLRTMVEAGAFF
jgi:predicted dehydrogenase